MNPEDATIYTRVRLKTPMVSEGGKVLEFGTIAHIFHDDGNVSVRLDGDDVVYGFHVVALDKIYEPLRPLTLGNAFPGTHVRLREMGDDRIPREGIVVHLTPHGHVAVRLWGQSTTVTCDLSVLDVVHPPPVMSAQVSEMSPEVRPTAWDKLLTAELFE